MEKAIATKNKLAYIAPVIEVLDLANSDVITASGASEAFWGEEHDFADMYAQQ